MFRRIVCRAKMFRFLFLLLLAVFLFKMVFGDENRIRLEPAEPAAPREAPEAPLRPERPILTLQEDEGFPVGWLMFGIGTLMTFTSVLTVGAVVAWVYWRSRNPEKAKRAVSYV